MKMGINNSNKLPEYLRIKYDIPNNVLVVFSFENNEIYNNDLDCKFVTKLDPKDIPDEWLNILPTIRTEMNNSKVKYPVVELHMENLGLVVFWEP